MTGYQNKYLEMLKAENTEKPLGQELPKLTKGGSVSFVSTQERPVSDFTPPYDAEGVPCGGCPSCKQGEFWRWPTFHKNYDHRGWVCWFCSPPPEGSGPWDFCGVPEDNAEDTPCNNF